LIGKYRTEAKLNTEFIDMSTPRKIMMTIKNNTTYRGLCSSVNLILLLLTCFPVNAHHVLGRPSYSLNEDSTTPPSMQVETQIGEYYITYMVFPAFPSPNQPGRVNLYASRIDNGEPFLGQVSFKVRDDSWFNNKQELLGVQEVDDNVFRQGFEFRDAGNYIIRAEFESNNEPYQIDFPLQIGKASALGPIGIAISVILFALIAVNLLQRKKSTNAKISNAHKARP
jgi:hypothetical protein